MGCNWQKVEFGATGLRVSPLAIGSSYGVAEKDLARAFERGVDFFFWGMIRRPGFGRGVRELARRDRDRMTIAVQTYTRVAALMPLGVERALRKLGTDHVDLLVVSWWQKTPPRRILEAALRLKEQGKVAHLMVSSHHRPLFAELAKDPAVEAMMLRYNAAHPGAEKEVFPVLGAGPGARPGVMAFTGTRWGSLLDPRLMPEGEPTPRASDCYRFQLSNPAVDVSLVGPKNGEELDEAMAALDRGPLSDEELAWMRRVGAKVRADTKSNRVLRFVDRMVGTDDASRARA